MNTHASYNDVDISGRRHSAPKSEMMNQGREAVRSNIENANDVGAGTHSQYPGRNFPKYENVPGSMSGEGYEAPPSVTEAMRDSSLYL